METRRSSIPLLSGLLSHNPASLLCQEPLVLLALGHSFPGDLPSSISRRYSLRSRGLLLGYSFRGKAIERERKMANILAAAKPYNLKKAIAGIRRIDLDGLRWRVFDAKNQILGRLASQIANVVQGKDKPTYTPNRDDGDMCIVLNAKEVCVTGRKLTDKKYYWHTGYMGHIKERTLKDQMTKDPTEVIRKAVLRMLPRNKLRDDRDRKLRIFTGSAHPFANRSLEPFEMPHRSVREMRPRVKRAMIRAQIKREQGVPVTNKNTEYKFSPRKRMKMEHAKRFFGITDP